MSNYRYVSHGMAGKPLKTGTDKNGQVYNRNLGFQPGYDDLVNIVAGLQKDVKKINQCITLEGAQAYVDAVDKNGDPIRKNWQAIEADITGPNGKPDGINEVFVTDAKGNLKIINGYTLGKSTYPVRKAYRTAFKTKDERKAHPFTQFQDELYQIGGIDAEGNTGYRNNPGTIGPEFANLQPRIDGRKVYKDLIFKPQYDVIKPVLAEQGLPPMAMAQLFNIGLRDAFDRHIKYPSLASLLGGDPDSFAPKVVNKVLRSAAYKNDILRRVGAIENSPKNLNTVQREIDELLSGLLDEFLGRNHRSPQRQGPVPPSPVPQGSP